MVIADCRSERGLRSRRVSILPDVDSRGHRGASLPLHDGRALLERLLPKVAQNIARLGETTFFVCALHMLVLRFITHELHLHGLDPSPSCDVGDSPARVLALSAHPCGRHVAQAHAAGSFRFARHAGSEEKSKDGPAVPERMEA